jgi:hypothetical protein
MDNQNNNIDKYYSLIDKNILNNLCKNESLKNLILLSTKNDINIFNKKNKQWHLKSKNILLKECEKIKKKEIKSSTNLLSNLAKLDNTTIDNFKSIYQNLENKIDNINKFIDQINIIDIDKENKNNKNIFKPKIININEHNNNIKNKVYSDDSENSLNNNYLELEFIEYYSNS